MIRSVMALLIMCAALTVSAFAAESGDAALYDKIPQKENGVSTGKALMCDLLPGGGHFYLGDYWRGTIFATGKLGGYGALYYFYGLYQERKQNYNRAVRTRNSLGVSSSTPIKGPDGRTRSTNGYKKDYDRSVQWMTFSVVGNVAIQTISMIMVYGRCQEINRETIPSFDVAILRDDKGPLVYCGLTARF
ncbi:MAG TPA: hypothetical protein VF857_03720 [Spirochaetota bacterium]